MDFLFFGLILGIVIGVPIGIFICKNHLKINIVHKHIYKLNKENLPKEEPITEKPKKEEKPKEELSESELTFLKFKADEENHLKYLKSFVSNVKYYPYSNNKVEFTASNNVKEYPNKK